MTDSVAIAQEQVAWWLAEGYTPREAFRALDGVLPRSMRLGWQDVLEAVAGRWETLMGLSGRRAA